MSFQAYLDNIETKSGKTPQDFINLAKEKGLTKYSELVAWLKKDFGLGLGHARALVHVITKGADISSKYVDTKSSHQDNSSTLNLKGKKK